MAICSQKENKHSISGKCHKLNETNLESYKNMAA
jgi:hypothetical protein